MAQATMTLRLETDLLTDAIASIELVMRKLVKCHGAPYRALERRIEALMDGDGRTSQPAFHQLEPCLHVVEPPEEWKAILREARELGIIN